MSSSARPLPVLLCLLAGLALACTSAPETPPPSEEAAAEEAKPKAPLKAPNAALAPPGRAKASSLPQGVKLAPSGPSYAEVKVTCCTNARVNRVLDRVLELHLALVAEKGAAGAMDALAQAARDAEKEGALEPASLAAVVAIAQAAEGASGGGLSEQRQALLVIGRQVEVLIPAHAGGARDLAKAKDPETGDAWFQREGRPQNPYGGTRAVFSR